MTLTRSCASLLTLATCSLRAEALRRNDNTEIADPFVPYDGMSLWKLEVCSSESVDMVSAQLGEGSCRYLSEPGHLALPRHGCARGWAACPPGLQLHGAELVVNGTAGQYFRAHSETPKPWDDQGVSLDKQRGDPFYSNWRTYDDIVGRIESLVSSAKGVAELTKLSPKTYEGRNILAVRLRGSGYKVGGPRMIFSYGLHAREWITHMEGVYAVEKAIAKAKAEPDWLAGKEAVFVPICNPDGFVFSAKSDRFWRKNKRPDSNRRCQGIDLNRNFDYKWEPATLFSRCRDDDAGPKAASEPETQALQALVDESKVSAHLDFHSYGGLVLGSWSYGYDVPKNIKEQEALGFAVEKAINDKESAGFKYCTVRDDDCTYLASGIFADYSQGKGGLGYVIESRPVGSPYSGFDPSPSQILPGCKEAYAAVLATVNMSSSAK